MAEVVSAKKQKVAEIQNKVDTSSLADDCCSKPEHCIEVYVILICCQN